MASAIQNLLDELSWEGTGVSYRGGGAGKENVLTAEVWQALDVLPRRAFLGDVLEKAHRVAQAVSTDEPTPRPLVEAALSRGLECEVLCGDRRSAIGGVRVQPDVLLESPDAVVIVEAKRVRGGVFQREQIARNALVLDEMRAGRAALLLLVLGSGPPVPVRALGHLTVAEALRVGLDAIRERDPRVPEPVNVGVEIAWITWPEISDIVRDANRTFTNGDPDVEDAVRRSAEQIINAVRFHTPP